MTGVLVIAGGFALWAVVHSLLAEFGEDYAAYGTQVSRFIPWPGRRFE